MHKLFWYYNIFCSNVLTEGTVDQHALSATCFENFLVESHKTGTQIHFTPQKLVS